MNLISLRHDPTQQSSITRRAGRAQIAVSCPPVLNFYTKHLCGMDVFSQRQSYSKIGRRSKKYFYSLIWFFIHNAFILYLHKSKPQHFGEKDFRKKLMQQLVGSYSGRKKGAAALKRPRDSLHHICHSEHRRACAGCRKSVGAGGNNQKTNWECSDCGMPLCMPDCYNEHIKALAQQAQD